MSISAAELERDIVDVDALYRQVEAWLASQEN
jgi:hypothetical protein